MKVIRVEGAVNATTSISQLYEIMSDWPKGADLISS